MSIVKTEIVHIPTVTLMEISARDLRQLFADKWTWRKLKLTDHNYFYVSWADWDKVFQHLLKRIPAYVPDKFDCENFAGYLRVMAAREFGINTCGDAEGYWDGMRHGWTVFTDGEELYQMESQDDIGHAFMDIDDAHYVPDELVIG